MTFLVWTWPDYEGNKVLRIGIDTYTQRKGPLREDPHIERCMYRRILWVDTWC